MKEKLKLFFEEVAEIRLVASSLAYSTLLSLIPFLVIVLSVFQYIGGMEELYPKVERLLFSSLRQATGSDVSQFLRGTLDGVNFQALGISGAIFLIVTSLGLIRNIDYAINRMWKLKITDAIYKRLALYWVIIFGIPVGMALFIVAKSVLTISGGVRSAEHQFLFSVWTFVFIFTLYKIIPHTKVKAIAALASAAVVSIGLWGVQQSFFWISLKVFKQNKIYGSLASLPIFLVWLLVIWYVVLLGVSLCVYLQKKLK